MDVEMMVCAMRAPDIKQIGRLRHILSCVQGRCAARGRFNRLAYAKRGAARSKMNQSLLIMVIFILRLAFVYLFGCVRIVSNT